MKKDTFLKVGFVFLASYAFLYVLGSLSSLTGMHNWGFTLDLFRLDYLYFLIPIPGFFMMFLLIDWVEEFFSTRFTRTAWFGVFFLCLAVVAFYVAVFWYYCNGITLNMGEQSACSANGASQTIQFLSAKAPNSNILLNFLSGVFQPFSSILMTNFSKLFLESAYLVFVLAGILGWLAKLVYFRLESK